MDATEMRTLSVEELGGRVGQWEEDLFRARCDKKIGQLADTSQVVVLRRQIARAKTVINEIERNAAE